MKKKYIALLLSTAFSFNLYASDFNYKFVYNDVLSKSYISKYKELKNLSKKEAIEKYYMLPYEKCKIIGEIVNRCLKEYAKDDKGKARKCAYRYSKMAESDMRVIYRKAQSYLRKLF